MDVSVSHSEGIKRELTITIPVEKIEPKVDEKAKEAAKTVRVDGFRPGKVPVKLIKQRYSDSLRSEVMGDLVQEAYFDAIKQEQLSDAGMPEIEIVSNKPGQALTFKAKLEVYPEFDIQGLENISIEKPVVQIKDSDVDDMLEAMRAQHGQWQSVDRAAEKGDKLTIDYKGFVDDEPFEGGEEQDRALTLGSEEFIAGFEEGLEGAKAGEDVTVNVKFPDNYHVDSLAGKPARFEVTVKDVQHLELPELNDELAQKLEAESVAALTKQVEKNMERELEFAIKNQVKQQVLDGLLEQNKIEVPEALAKQEIEHVKRDAMRRMGMAVENMELPLLPDELFSEQAGRRVKLGLLMRRALEQYQLTVDEARVDEMLEKIASAYDDPSEAIEKIKNDPKEFENLRQVVLEDQIIDKVIESMQVTDVEKQFKDLMGSNQ